MQVHDLKPKKNNNKKRKRVGRGGKRGTYSGRGVKGQKARAGATTPSAEKDIIKKFPKLLGTKNKSHRPPVDAVNVSELEAKFEEGAVVNMTTLKEVKLIKNRSKRAKILGDGDISKKLTVKNVPVSESAKEKIKKAGGKIENK